MLHDLAPELATCAPGQLRAARLPHLRTVIRMGATAHARHAQFRRRAGRRGRRAPGDGSTRSTAALRADDPINIQFTSGTTGAPKGATLTHHNIVNNAHFVARGAWASPSATGCASRCRSTTASAWCMGMLACVTSGAAMVFPGEGFEPGGHARRRGGRALHRALRRADDVHRRCSTIPTSRSYDLSSLRTGIMAGAPCPIEVMKRVVADMHMSEVTIAYGMTETSPVSFQSGTDDPLEQARVHGRAASIRTSR